MLTVIILLLVGLLLLLLEAFVPGGIVGTIGTAVIAISVIFCYSRYGAGLGTVYLLASAALAIAVAASAFFFISRRMALSPPEPAGETAHGLDPRVGARGRVTRTLSPTGYVEIEGKRRTISSQAASTVGVRTEGGRDG